MPFVPSTQHNDPDESRNIEVPPGEPVRVTLKPALVPVRIKTIPPEATVRLDGEDRETKDGIAKLRLRPKVYKLDVTHPGYQPKTQGLQIKVGLPEDVEIRLEPAPVAVHIKTDPAEARVRIDKDYLDGKKVASLLPGSHTIEVTHPGFRNLRESIDVPISGKSITRSYRLVRDSSPKEVANSAGMKLMLIPAGKFHRGSPPEEAKRAPAEGPVREIEITRAFYMGAHEVSQKQFEEVMKKNPSLFTRELGGGPNHPVGSVTYEEAVEFCKALSGLPAEKKAGRRYRLPTEAEWEYACRAGSKTAYHHGKDEDALKRAGWYSDNSDGKTHPVGEKSANAWGLFDMHGNVWEWCSDAFDAKYYATAPDRDPPGPAAKEPHTRVLRGGGYSSPAAECRSAQRFYSDPRVRGPYGFRVVCEAAK